MSFESQDVPYRNHHCGTAFELEVRIGQQRTNRSGAIEFVTMERPRYKNGQSNAHHACELPIQVISHESHESTRMKIALIRVDR